MGMPTICDYKDNKLVNDGLQRGKPLLPNIQATYFTMNYNSTFVVQL